MAKSVNILSVIALIPAKFAIWTCQKRPKEDSGHKFIFIIKNEWPIITEASLEIILAFKLKNDRKYLYQDI
jgi:hypothetical protein